MYPRLMVKAAPPQPNPIFQIVARDDGRVTITCGTYRDAEEASRALEVIKDVVRMEGAKEAVAYMAEHINHQHLNAKERLHLQDLLRSALEYCEETFTAALDEA